MSPSLLRTAVDVVEPAIGRPLERLTASSEFAFTAALVHRLRRSIGRRVDAVGSWTVHRAALASHADMRRMQRQLATVERQLSALRRELDEERTHRDGAP